MFIKTHTAETVIGCAISVHRAVGPGLLESAYHACLRQEFLTEGLRFKEQVAVPVRYRGVLLDCGYRLDYVVNEELVLELKSSNAHCPSTRPR
jgi:GxxExxY protein